MWDFLNNCDVWCINLISRPDKYKHCIEQFKKLNLLDKVKFYQPEKYKGHFLQKGCWDSHKHCLRISYKNKKNALIFEDDFLVIDNWEQEYYNIKKSYERQDWDLLRLGAYIYIYKKKIHDKMWTGDWSATHCYFINNEFIKKCLDDENFCAEKYHLKGIDEYYRYESEKDYTIVPQIIWQNNFDSDNEWHDSHNLWQSIFEYKPIMVFNQKCLNTISWYLRYCPTFIKYLNPYAVMFYLNDKFHYYFK